MAKIPLLDYAFLAFETDRSPKHVGGLQIFSLPKNAPDDFVARLVERVTVWPPQPPFNQRIDFPWLSRPEWLEDAQFDFANHVFHEQLPEPHTLALLLERVAELHAHNLDRTIPLWEVHFFEHLEDRRFAVYFKVHHAYMDGISLSRVATAALSDAPDEESDIMLWGADQHLDHEGVSDGIIAAVFGGARRVIRGAAAVPALARVGLMHSLRLLRLSGRELPVPFTAPRTAFNSPLTRRRSLAVTRLPLARMRHIAQHAGVTVNDVLLELCDWAMTRYLEDHHEMTDKPLVAQMPVALPREDAGGQRNQFTIALIELGSEETNPVKRLQHIRAHSLAVKKEFRNMPPEAAEAYTVLLQSVAQIADLLPLGRLLPPLGNVVISNVQGPEKPLYMGRARMQAVYPVSTIAPGTAINITSYSYEQNLHIGIVCGARAIPDVAELVHYIDKALPDLEARMALKEVVELKRGAAAGGKRGGARKTRRGPASRKPGGTQGHAKGEH